jgi:hypothetical protein
MSGQSRILARVGIDADSLLDFAGPDRASTNAHRSLTRVLGDVGVLEAIGSDDARALFDAIAGLSPETRNLWTETLSALDIGFRIRRGTASGTTSQALHDPAGIPASLLGLMDLIVASEVSADLHGVPATVGYSKRDGEPELSLADSVEHCSTITDVRRVRSEGHFPQGSLRADIEDALFAPLAVLSTHVTILDRFFLAHTLDPKSDDRDHLEWLVRSLDASMRPSSSLRLLCELPESVSRSVTEQKKLEKNGLQSEAGRKRGEVSQMCRDIQAKLRARIEPLLGAKLTTVEVVLARWPWRQEDRPHNRHARFNCSIAIGCHEGFDHLDATEIRGIDGFTWQAVTAARVLDDLARREQKVIKAWPRREYKIEARQSARRTTVPSPAPDTNSGYEFARKARPTSSTDPHA